MICTFTSEAPFCKHPNATYGNEGNSGFSPCPAEAPLPELGATLGLFLLPLVAELYDDSVGDSLGLFPVEEEAPL